MCAQMGTNNSVQREYNSKQIMPKDIRNAFSFFVSFFLVDQVFRTRAVAVYPSLHLVWGVFPKLQELEMYVCVWTERLPRSIGGARAHAIKHTRTKVGYVGIFGTAVDSAPCSLFKQKQLQSSPVLRCPTAGSFCVFRNAAFHRHADKVQTILEERPWLLRARRTSFTHFGAKNEMECN